MSANPWNLTDREAEVMDAMVEHGCIKLASRALGIENKTVDVHLWRAGKKMPHRFRLLRLLAWDRWRRSAAA